MGILDSIFGGSGETTTTSVPEWLKPALQENIARSQAMSRIGYTPYYGATVAAMTPSQTSAMTNNANMMRGYGMQAPSNQNLGMPQARNYGGMMAYSSGDLYDQAMNELKARRPAQYDAMRSFFIDPVTGARSQYDQDLINQGLIDSGIKPELAGALASGDGDSISRAGDQLGMSAEMINRLRSLPTNPLMPLGILGLITNSIADYYAGDYGKEGNPAIYDGDMFYRAAGIPTPVRGSDFYSSTEAANNRNYSGGGYTGSSSGSPSYSHNVGRATTGGQSGGGNASRGFRSGGW